MKTLRNRPKLRLISFCIISAWCAVHVVVRLLLSFQLLASEDGDTWPPRVPTRSRDTGNTRT